VLSPLEETPGALRADQIPLSLAASLPIALLEKLAARRLPVFRPCRTALFVTGNLRKAVIAVELTKRGLESTNVGDLFF
jgi:hypothetical protein